MGREDFIQDICYRYQKYCNRGESWGSTLCQRQLEFIAVEQKMRGSVDGRLLKSDVEGGGILAKLT